MKNLFFTQQTRILSIVTVAIGPALFLASGLAAAETTPDSETVKMESVQVDATALQNNGALVPVLVTPQTVEPDTVLGRNFIQNAVAPTVDYSEIMNYAPSVAVFPTGLPGSQETVTMSIRGFQDGQFNVTFDGIPFGDTNDFTHHSNDYFTPVMLETVAVDRGPGSASTIGEATFGGTVALGSRKLQDAGVAEVSETIGNFNTQETELSLQTGSIASLGGAHAYFSYDHEENDGWDYYTGLRRSDYLFKFDKPIGPDTLVTGLLTVSNSFYYTNLGATAEQIATVGPRFGLNNNPQSQAYYAWNYQPKNTDMEYIQVQTRFGNLHVDEKLYSYSYLNKTETGADLSGETPNGTVLGNALFGPNNNDVPGYILPYNQYRAYGNVIRLTDDLSFGTLEAGLWNEYQRNLRYGYNVDYTLGGAYDELPGTNTALVYYMDDYIRTLQPYVQFDWKPLPGLTVTPGVKYISFERSIESPRNPGTGGPTYYNKTYSATMPSVSVNDQVSNDFSFYAQAAKGFLAPNLNLFYINNPGDINVSPQQTMNYQAGLGYKHGPFSVSFDAYYIDFNNLIGKRTIGPNTYYFNQGGATYKGVELEASYVIGDGFSLYANGSLNRAVNKSTGQDIAESPSRTAVAGFLFNKYHVTASLMEKYIGPRYGDVGQTIPIGGYTLGTASLGYALPTPFPLVKQIKLRFTVDNLFNKSGIADLASYTPINNLPMYWTIVGRNYYATATFDF